MWEENPDDFQWNREHLESLKRRKQAALSPQNWGCSELLALFASICKNISTCSFADINFKAEFLFSFPNMYLANRQQWGTLGKNIHKSWFNYFLTHFHAIHHPRCLLKSSANLFSFDCQKSFFSFFWHIEQFTNKQLRRQQWDDAQHSYCSL